MRSFLRTALLTLPLLGVAFAMGARWSARRESTPASTRCEPTPVGRPLLHHPSSGDPPTEPTSGAPQADPLAKLERCEQALSVAERLLEAHDERERGRPMPMPDPLIATHTPETTRLKLEDLARRCQLGDLKVHEVDCSEYPCIAMVSPSDPAAGERILSCQDQGEDWVSAVVEVSKNQDGRPETRQVWSVQDRAYMTQTGPDELLEARESWRSQELVKAWAETATPP